MSKDQLRQPAGTPIGGQYASDPNASNAAPVDLDVAEQSFSSGCGDGCGCQKRCTDWVLTQKKKQARAKVHAAVLNYEEKRAAFEAFPADIRARKKAGEKFTPDALGAEVDRLRSERAKAISEMSQAKLQELHLDAVIAKRQELRLDAVIAKRTERLEKLNKLHRQAQRELGEMVRAAFPNDPESRLVKVVVARPDMRVEGAALGYAQVYDRYGRREDILLTSSKVDKAVEVFANMADEYPSFNPFIGAAIQTEDEVSTIFTLNVGQLLSAGD